MFPHGYFAAAYFGNGYFPAWSVTLVTPAQVYDLTGSFTLSSSPGGAFAPGATFTCYVKQSLLAETG